MTSFTSKTRQPSIRFRTVRAKSQRTTPNSRHGKHWNPIFSKERECSDHAVYEDWSEQRKNSDESRPCERELVTMLLGSLGESNASWETKVLMRFLLQQGDEESTAEDDHAWALVDDREISGGRSRQYSCSFDAHGLQEILKEARFGLPTLPNVDQRMIYISRLTPGFVSTLAKTGWHHQMKALRDAVWKHIASETSLSVHIPITDFNIYQLEFHMPHLLLRPSPQAAGSTSEGSIADLSFVNLATASGEVVPHSIYQGHMSVVICGWSNLQWTGYAFTRDDNGNLKAEGFNELRDHLTSKYGFDFATPTQSVQPWDARRYWLHLVAHCSRYILREWLHLVQTIEEGIEARESQDPCNSIATQGNILEQDIKKSLEKTIQTTELLRQLRNALSVTLRAYSRFSKPGGDICYFSDITNCSAAQNSISEIFDGLTDLLLRVNTLDNSCKRFTTHLGRMINLENNRLIMQTNLLDQESNTHHAATNRLNERINELNQETIVLTKEMRELSKRSAEAACANQAEATKTSRSTQVNIELLLFTTPLAMVLQYFGSVEEILFFKPSPMTLVVATLVLMLLLRVLVLAIPHGGALLCQIFRNAVAHKKASQPPNRNQGDDLELRETRNI